MVLTKNVNTYLFNYGKYQQKHLFIFIAAKYLKNDFFQNSEKFGETENTGTDFYMALFR